MDINILGEEYKVIDAKEKITIADSFVRPNNKIGSGNGEAKLYVGQENENTRDFFGQTGFELSCFLLKSDLLKYLEDTKTEYFNPQQPYNRKELLKDLWQERVNDINELPDKIIFSIYELINIAGPRIYVNSEDSNYTIIRELSLPNITYITVVELENLDGEKEYYFRLFADFFGDVSHPFQKVIDEKKIDDELEEVQDEVLKQEYREARKGQGKYREDLLKLCPLCPITLVGDERILIASHIKPYSKSEEHEKLDPYNGIMFTPTFDKLFDRGFLSFTDDKRSILSPYLSPMTYKQIGISNNKIYTHLPVEGREGYLEYHRNEVFQGV